MENGSKIYEIYKESMPFNKAAVFSDGTASYRIPPEPMPYESVLRIRKSARFFYVPEKNVFL